MTKIENRIYEGFPLKKSVIDKVIGMLTKGYTHERISKETELSKWYVSRIQYEFHTKFPTKGRGRPKGSKNKKSENIDSVSIIEPVVTHPHEEDEPLKSEKEVLSATNSKKRASMRWKTDEILYVALTMKDVADHIGKFLGRALTSIYTMRSNINRGEHDEILRDAGFFKKEEGGKWLIPKTEENQVREAAKQVATERHQPDRKKASMKLNTEGALKIGDDNMSPNPDFKMPEGWTKENILALTHYKSTVRTDGVNIRKLSKSLDKPEENITQELLKMKNGYYNYLLRRLGGESPFWGGGDFSSDIEVVEPKEVSRESSEQPQEVAPSVKKRGLTSALTQEIVDMTVIMLKQGKNYKEIRKVTGISQGSVGRIKRKHFPEKMQKRKAETLASVPETPPLTFPDNLPVKSMDDTEQKIVELITAGKTYKEIQKELGVNTGTIAEIKRKFFPDQMQNYKTKKRKQEDELSKHEKIWSEETILPAPEKSEAKVNLEPMTDVEEQSGLSEPVSDEVQTPSEEQSTFVRVLNEMKEKMGDVARIKEELKQEVKDELLKDLISVGRDGSNSDGGYDEFNQKKTFKISLLWGAFEIKRKNIS